MSTRPQSQLKIRVALATAKRPLKMSELAVMTGLARNTLIEALATDEAIAKLEGFPARYELTDIPEVFDSTALTVPYVDPSEGWPAWVEQAREKVPAMLKLDPRMSEEKRDELAYLLRGMGQYLVSLSRDLHKTKKDPDWYQQLGGKLD